MDILPNATDTPPTESVVSSGDYFAETGSAAPILPASTEPLAVAPQTANPSAADATAQTDPSATPPATEQVSTETVATAETTEPPATTEGDDPWASLELDDTTPPPAAQPASVTEAMQAIATSLGLEKAPATPAELQAAVEQTIQARVQELTHDPIRVIDQSLGLSDRELVKADLNQHRTKYETDASIEAKLDELEADERIETIAGELRSELTTQRTQLKQTRDAQLQQQASDLLAAQQQMDRTIQSLTDPRGKAIPDKAKQALSHYGASGQYLDDLLNQPAEWHAAMMARLHPKIGPVYRQQEESVAALRGASQVYKELEHQTPELGGGAALPPKEEVVDSSSFFSN